MRISRESKQTPARSSEDRQRQERLTSLHLSKSRLLEQLERARHPTHREGLLKGLRAVELEIDRLMSDKLIVSLLQKVKCIPDCWDIFIRESAPILSPLR